MPEYVLLGGFSLVHQFCIIGDYAMTAFAAGVHKDVPPYVMAAGYRAEPAGLNTEGLRRHHFTPEQINNIKRLYKILYRQGLNYSDAQAKIIAEADSAPELQVFKEFFDWDWLKNDILIGLQIRFYTYRWYKIVSWDKLI